MVYGVVFIIKDLINYFFEIGNGANEYVARNSLSTYMPKGYWHDLTLVLDTSETGADKWKLYIDGLNIAWSSTSGIFEGTSTSTSNLRLASDKTSYASFDFEGNIGNFLIYDRALTASEVLQNYNATKNRFQ